MDPAGSFGRWLRWRRRILELTQEDLARKVGCSIVSIRKFESDERHPSLGIAERLARCLTSDPEEGELIIRFARGSATPRSFWLVDSLVPPAQPASGLHTNLPTPLTALFGRVQDVAAVSNRLLHPEQRLISLIGAPGIGKTRLAITVGWEVRPAFPDGVFFVSLASIRDPALLPLTILQALGVSDTDKLAVEQGLSHYLGNKQLLLVLDNMEQVADAAPMLVTWLEQCPKLKLLITSRAALHLRCEQRYPVAPLLLPKLDGRLTLAEIMRSPAVALFLQRAQAVRPDFQLSADNAALVAELCHRLDGLPLAIELVAARIDLFTPQAMLLRLCRMSELVSAGACDLPVRQQTLWNAISWSYELLKPAEQRLFRCLAVFAGSWSLEAAQAVAQALDERPLDVLERIAPLVDQSLVRLHLGEDGEPRFSMLETIREYALERLAASGELEDVRQQLASYYLALAERSAATLQGPQQGRWLRRLETEQPNLRAVLAWCSAHDRALGLRLATLLQQFWHARSFLAEGRAWLGELLAATQHRQVDAVTRSYALCAAGWLASQQGDFAQAATYSEQGLALARAHGEHGAIAAALSTLGNIAREQNHYAQAIVLYRQSLALYQELGDSPATAQLLKNLGLVAKDQGAYAEATALFEEGLALYQALGDTQGIAWLLFSLAVVAYWQGDYLRATLLSQQSLALHRELGNTMGAAYALETLAMALQRQGQLQRAMLVLEESLALLRALDDSIGIALVLTSMGELVEAQGDSPRAAQLHRQSLRLCWKLGDKRRVAFCLEGLAMAARLRQPRQAALLFGATAGLREAIGAPLPPAESSAYAGSIAALQSELGATAFAASWADGRALPLEQVIADALEAEGSA